MISASSNGIIQRMILQFALYNQKDSAPPRRTEGTDFASPQGRASSSGQPLAQPID